MTQNNREEEGEKIAQELTVASMRDRLITTCKAKLIPFRFTNIFTDQPNSY